VTGSTKVARTGVRPEATGLWSDDGRSGRPEALRIRAAFDEIVTTAEKGAS
jgi:hypothetical protein